MEKKKAKIGLVALVLVSMIVLVGTYAYWNQTASIDNPFNTSTYGTKVIEQFNPEDGEDWEPGATVDKVVTAVNTGDYDIIVRAKLDETWTFSDDTTKTLNAETDTDATDSVFGDVYTVYQEDAEDGLTENDTSVVTKTINTTTANGTLADGSIDTGTWVDGGDGWYYYSINLAPGATTAEWLQAVTLLANADMGYYTVTYYVTTADAAAVAAETAAWVVYNTSLGMPTYIDTNGTLVYLVDGAYYTPDSGVGAAATLVEYTPTDAGDLAIVTHNTAVTALDESLHGYSGSDYLLTVTIETVQATEDAVSAVFGDGTTYTAPSGTSWVYVTVDEPTATS